VTSFGTGRLRDGIPAASSAGDSQRVARWREARSFAA
jgi:hypothetical protein